MKKDIISFCFDEVSLKSFFSALQINVDFNFGTDDINKLMIPDEGVWDLHLKKYSSLLSVSTENSVFMKAALDIKSLEVKINDHEKNGEMDTFFESAFKLNEKSLSYFTEENPDPLSVYPLFARWFFASTLLHAKALKTNKISCIECTNYWKKSKDYLDKSVVFIVGKVKLSNYNDGHDNAVINAIQELGFVGNYKLLEILESALIIKENSMIKKDDLLPAASFFNEIINDLSRQK